MTETLRKVESKRVQMTDEIRQAVLAQLDRGVYYGGEQAFRFEHELASYLGARHVVTVNSGTSALLVAAMALEIGPHDEVLVPANAYVSSAEVPAFLGAIPVFCDIEEDTTNIAVSALTARLSSRTKAVIVTHMYGHPADLDGILAVTRPRGVAVIEVCAHALGAQYKGSTLGTLGDLAIFSLGSKNISMCATAGAVATNSDALYQEVARISRHGWTRQPIRESFFDTIRFADSPTSGMFPVERNPVRPGLNIQLDEIPCAIGRVALRHLEEWNERRRAVANLYTRLIEAAGSPVRPPTVHAWAKHAFLHYVVRAQRRDALFGFLLDSGIEALVHYPQPLPELRYYHEHYPTPRNVYPVTARLVREILSLPIHPWISDSDVEYVVDKVKAFYRQGSGA